ncbi:MAG: hypothetical protein ACRDQ4_26090 [Pseudonocardiaceae bacterium]
MSSLHAPRAKIKIRASGKTPHPNPASPARRVNPRSPVNPAAPVILANPVNPVNPVSLASPVNPMVVEELAAPGERAARGATGPDLSLRPPDISISVYETAPSGFRE